MQPLVGLIMGSASDWETLQHAALTLERAPPRTCRAWPRRRPFCLKEFEAIRGMIGVRHPGQPKADSATVAGLALASVTP